MIAIAIMAILAVTVGPTFLGYLSRAKVSKAKIEVKAIKNAIDVYNGDTNEYPAAIGDLIKRPTENEELARKWNGPYLKGGKEETKDSWGKKWHYELTPGAAHPYELYSYGPSGKRDAPKHDWIDAWVEE